jgi:RNA polymerase sigma factor (sigma-70 family)
LTLGAELNPASQRFERLVLPHLDAAYNLARWLTRKPHDADDVVQESVLRAFAAFPAFHGGDARCWLLKIVRNTCFTWLRKNHLLEQVTAAFDDRLHDVASDAGDPQRLLLGSEDRKKVREAIEQLPVEFREVIILREMEGLSYGQIGAVAGIPIGTVMSRLARGRERLAKLLAVQAGNATREAHRPSSALPQEVRDEL